MALRRGTAKLYDRLSTLTYRQRVFVVGLVECQTPKQAAQTAGYSTSAAAVTQLLATNAIKAAIHEAIRDKLGSDSLVLMQRTMHSFIADTGTPAPVGFYAAKAVLGMHGFQPSKTPIGPVRDLSELAEGQLQQMLGKVMDQLRQTREPATLDVTPEPVAAGNGLLHDEGDGVNPLD